MKAILGSLFVLFSLATQAAQLTIPDTFEVLSVDGEEQSKSYFTKETTLDLASGKHAVQIQYREMFEHDTEDHHETVRSAPFVLIFTVNGNDALQLNHPQQLGIEAARAYAKSPQVKLVDANGDPVRAEQLSQKQYQQDLMSLQQQKRQQVVKQSLSDDPGEFRPHGPDTVEMLEYWWELATDSERQEFIRYLQEEHK
ncbi:DUF2057 domain-containing protein [Thalassotalea litorea]|uniref:DUF2057 domain-containing protein n=1 Tax=Thalassotalea litorea TaxID=2020715 RepID=A0A5R9IRB2_9GAMM|nr:DUF2057 domain-containing protein [Thalassotalea litorea]TLU68065.1 DUF2057 domain-containing protein [Thalassotalea litorea]